MTDPYSGGAHDDPQSRSILYEAKQRYRAQTCSDLRHYKKAEDVELNDALRRWTTIPSPSIHLALVDYFNYKDVPFQTRQMRGIDESFRIAQIYTGLWMTVGPNLRLNTMSDEVELNGQTVAGKESAQLLLRNNGWEYGRLPSFEELEVYAQSYKYSPVEEYLLKLVPTDGDHRETLYDLGRYALGITNKLSLTMVAKTLIGAVARALSPGCEQQTCFVLQGPQGAGKTAFLKVLFGPDFFGHLDTNRDQRDWAMAMATKWCVELGELEAFTSKKSAGMLKNFLSSATDTYRRPYDRKMRTVKRHSVCVGSVNVGCPLVDETGNRRYWMVTVGETINLEWVRENRDRVWAAAKALFEAGEPWWFSGETERLVMERSEEFRQKHPWEEMLSEWLPALLNPSQLRTPRLREMMIGLDLAGPLTTNALLEALGVPRSTANICHSRQLGSIMHKLGWSQRSTKVKGSVIKVWKPDKSL